MKFHGITLKGQRDAGGCIVTYFTIRRGQEAAAGRDLLACLAKGAEVGLRNDLDEGHEGCTFFRRRRAGIVAISGGHGWQGNWKSIDDDEFLAAVARLAPHNRRGQPGMICRRKSPKRKQKPPAQER